MSAQPVDLALDLDPTSPTFMDLQIVNGDLVWVTGKDAIKQNILQRLNTYAGEWFLDVTAGLPYFDQILVKNPDQGAIEALIQNEILNTPGVVALVTFSVSVNFSTRVLTINFSVATTDGIVDWEGALAA